MIKSSVSTHLPNNIHPLYFIIFYMINNHAVYFIFSKSAHAFPVNNSVTGYYPVFNFSMQFGYFFKNVGVHFAKVILPAGSSVPLEPKPLSASR